MINGSWLMSEEGEEDGGEEEEEEGGGEGEGEGRGGVAENY